MRDPAVLELLLGDVVRLRRTHPCGGRDWRIDRLGADIGLRCVTCGRHVMLERRLVERRLVAFLSRGDRAMNDAVNEASPSSVPDDLGASMPDAPDGNAS